MNGSVERPNWKQLRLSEEAEQQLYEILSDVRAEFSNTVYQRVKHEIFGTLALIERFPRMGEVVSKEENVRRTTVARMNNVYWVITEDEVVVHAILRRGQAVRKGW